MAHITCYIYYILHITYYIYYILQIIITYYHLPHMDVDTKHEAQAAALSTGSWQHRHRAHFPKQRCAQGAPATRRECDTSLNAQKQQTRNKIIIGGTG
jgi:hypothetical protein